MTEPVRAAVLTAGVLTVLVGAFCVGWAVGVMTVGALVTLGVLDLSR